MKSVFGMTSVGLIVSIVYLAGCVPSLHPLFTADDVVFEESLIGTWTEGQDTGKSWQFTKLTEHSYRLVHTDQPGQSGTFAVRLVKMSDHHFLDLYPIAPKPAGNDFYQFHYRPTHTFALVRQFAPTVKLSFMNHGWFRNYLRNHPDAVDHIMVNKPNEMRKKTETLDNDREFLILTASTIDLQQFLLEHIDSEDAFLEPVELTPMETTER